MGTDKGLYEKIEDKYYDFLDWLESTGVPVYKVVDFFEEKNIPSFPIAVLLLLIVLGGLGFFLSGFLFAGQTELTVFVSDLDGNPVANAQVIISVAGGEALPVVSTDSAGSVKVNVPRGAELSIEASKEPDFLSKTDSVTLENDSQNFSLTLEKKVTMLSKSVKLLRPGTNELVEGFVEVQFSCSSNTSFSQSKTTTNGFLNLDVPNNCGQLRAAPQGDFSAENSSFDALGQQTIELFLQEQVIGHGDVLITVKDSGGASVGGARVNLLVQSTLNGLGTIYEFKDTSLAGTAVFSDVPEGKYFVTVSDPTGVFAEFDSSTTGDVKSLAVDGQISFAVVLERRVVGSIKLLLRDKATLAPIENALVTLNKDSSTIFSKETGADGVIEFSVGEQVPYSVVVDKQGYLIESMSVSPRAESYNIDLQAATTQNSQSLTVTVVDEVGKPVEDVRLSLRSFEDDLQVGSEVLTGVNGVGVFQRVQEGSFYVSALKPGFGEAISPTIELSLRQQNSLQLTLEIGFGNIELQVFDGQKQGVAGASVSLVNFFSGEVLEQGVTDADGLANLSARADKKAFAVVTAQGFLPYTTVPVDVGKDVTHNRKVELEKEISSLSLEFVGLFAGDEIVNDSATPSLSAGQRYRARFLLLVPQGSNFDEAGVHIRTGEAEENVSNVMEKDALFIGNAKSAFNGVLRGTSFTPLTGATTDALHYTTSDAKWVEMSFNEPSAGVIEIDTDLVVRENAKQGETLDLWYRAFGKSGGYIRFPADSVLGSAENTALKQGLYAQARNKKFSVGPTNLCFNDFCSTIVVENISEEVQTSVFEEFLADASSKYRLKFSFSSVSDEVFPGVELKVEDAQGAIEISGFEVTTVSGEKVQRTVNGTGFSVQVGDVRKDDIFLGNFEFEPKTDGATTLSLGLFSGASTAKERFFEKQVLLNIQPARKMNIDIVPKIIVPFVNNNALVKVTDEGEQTVSGAFISVKKNSSVIANGQTNSQGIFPFSVAAPNAGETILITAQKKGFKQQELEISVTENILSTEPKELKDTLVVGNQPEKETALALLNLTQIPLVISSVEASPSFDDLIEFEFPSSVRGQTIDVNGSAELALKFSLTKNGETVLEPATVDGTINIVVENTEFAKSWQTTIPAQVRIGFGDEVDDADCLVFFPDEWKVFSSTSEVKSISVNVQNTCRVNGSAVALGSLKARLNLGSNNQIGEFRAAIENEGEIGQFTDEEADLSEPKQENSVLNLQGLSGIVLSTAFKELAPAIPANSESTITIEFKPDAVASAVQEISIDFRADHATQKGVEQIRGKVNTSINLNDLSACININPPETMRLTACPFNTGYNLFPDYFSGLQGYGGYPQSYGSGALGTYGGGLGFGNDPYGAGYGLNGSGLAYGYGQGFGQGTFADPNYRGFDPYQSQLAYGSTLPSYLTSSQTYLQGGQQNYPLNYGNYSSLTFPYSNYSAPYYGGDEFSPNAGSAFGCQAGQLRVTNNCSESVDLSFESTEALYVDQPALTLEKGKQQTVLVRPTYFAGTYPLDVSAKLSQSSEQPKQIANIKANVQNRLTQSYRDCISINPPRNLKFNNFYGKPAVLEVRNSCADIGVRLFRTNDTIFFPSDVLRAPTDISGSGVHEMIENWALLDEIFEVGEDGRTVQVQRFEIFKALKNYCNTAPAFPNPDTQNPFAVLGNLRYFFSQGYYSVKSRSNVVVNFFTEVGDRKSITFPLVIEDLWEAVPFAERLVSYGDPNFAPAQCVQTAKLNLKQKYGGKCIPETELALLEEKGFTTDGGGANGLLKVSIPLSNRNNCGEYFERSGYNQSLGIGSNSIDQRYYNPSYIDGQNVPVRTGSAQSFPGQLEQGGCGTVDTISDVTPAVIEKNGIKIGVSVRNNQEIFLSFDASEWRAQGKPKTEISENVFLTVNRVVPAASDRTSIPLSFCVDGGTGTKPPVTPPDGDKPVTPETAQVCSNGGKTGDDAFKGYGFDKLLFDWRPEQVNASACDINGYYCDAAQFSVALNKKLTEIKKVADSAQLKGDCSFEANSIAEDCKKDSQNLYRYFTKRIGITDEAAETDNTWYLFFANDDGFIENTVFKEGFAKNEEAKKLQAEILNSSTSVQRVIARTLSLIELLETEQTLKGTEVLILLDKSELENFKDDEIKILGLGMQEVTVAEKKYFAMTLKEYKKMFSNLQKATSEGAQECVLNGYDNCWFEKVEDKFLIVKIEKTFGDYPGVEINTAFLNAFQKALENGKIVFGIRSVENVEPEKTAVVMKSITSGFGVQGYKDFYEFYSKNIGFTSQLMKDGFSADFKTDFKEAYKAPAGLITGDFEKWEFKSEQVDAGEYKTTLIFDWSEKDKPMVLVELKQLRPLNSVNENFAQNPLFSFPLDGTVGLVAGKGFVQRDGYGVNLDPQNNVADLLRFNHYSDPAPELDPFLYFNSKPTERYSNSFNPNNTGEFLKLSKTSVEFTPTDPIGIEVKLRKTTPQGTPAGLLYTLNDGTGIVNSNSLLKWSFSKDEIGKLSGKHADSKYQRYLLCGAGPDERNGLVFSGANTGETILRTVLFAPTRYGGTVSDTILNIDCFKDSAQARYFDPASGNSNAGITKALSAGENNLNNANTQRLLDAYTVKKFVEMIKDNSKLVCVNVSNSELSMSWNQDKILEKFS